MKYENAKEIIIGNGVKNEEVTKEGLLFGYASQKREKRREVERKKEKKLGVREMKRTLREINVNMQLREIANNILNFFFSKKHLQSFMSLLLLFEHGVRRHLRVVLPCCEIDHSYSHPSLIRGRYCMLLIH